MTLAPASGRLREIDALRGIAACWVAAFHFTRGISLYWLRDDPERAAMIMPVDINLEGLLGVDLFFMISGFVIYMTLERSRSVPDFILSRFSRLYPGYWTCYLITLAVILLAPQPVQTVTAGEAVAGLTMANLFFGYEKIDPSYWSLAFELAFYALMAILLALKQLDRIEIIGAVWLLLSALLFRVFPHLGAALPWRVQLVTALPFAPLFLGGILLYRIRHAGPTIPRLVLLAACFITYTSGAANLSLLLGSTGMFLLFTVTACGWMPFLAVRPLVFLGTISYAVYLLHQSIGFRIQEYVVIRAGGSAWAGFAAAILSIGMLATLVTFGVERPAQPWIRDRYAKWRAVRPRADVHLT